MITEPVYTYDDFKLGEPRTTLLASLRDRIIDAYENVETFDYSKNVRAFFTANPKIYVRVYKPTGHFYIGSTTQEYVIFRHHKDIVHACVNDDTRKICVFYRSLYDRNMDAVRLLNTINGRAYDHTYVFSSDWAIITIAQFADDSHLHTKVEAALINMFANNQTTLPADLCLKTITYVSATPTGKRPLFCSSLTNADNSLNMLIKHK